MPNRQMVKEKERIERVKKMKWKESWEERGKRVANELKCAHRKLIEIDDRERWVKFNQ